MVRCNDRDGRTARRSMAPALLALAGTVLVAAGARGDEGRFPVAAATTIAQPGHYVVTRDIAIASGTAITIDADDVTLDLNGHLISNAGTTGDVVLVNGTNLILRNGRISGGARAIQHLGPRIRFRIEDVEISGSQLHGIQSSDTEYVEILRCRFSNVVSAAINISGGSAAFGGRFVDNTMENVGRGIGLTGLRGGEVRGNRVTDTTIGASGAILLTSDPAWGAGGNLIADNTVRNGAFWGIHIQGDVPDNIVAGNVVTGSVATGLQVESDGNHVGLNTVSNNGAAGIFVSALNTLVRKNQTVGNGGNGIALNGQYNLVEGNLSQGNTGAGISFAGSDHAYRDNMLRGNTAGAVSGAGLATDAGGNVL